MVGGSTLGRILLAPDEPDFNDDSELFLDEDRDSSCGMRIGYDGPDHRLETRGRNTVDGDLGPGLEIQRDTDRIRAEKWNRDPPCYGGSFFTDCANRTVTDNTNHLIWLKNAGCFPLQNVYWTSSTAVGGGAAYQADTVAGQLAIEVESTQGHVWPVRNIRWCGPDR